MGIVINRVYTRTGDHGTTRLAGGQELDKDAARLEAYGSIDELNAVLGLTSEAIGSDEGLQTLRARILRIQNELFDLGGGLATLPEDRHEEQILLAATDVERLEREIDEVNAELPSLRSFVLPGGGTVSAWLHLARTVCRRCERRLITLHRQEPQREVDLGYLNRLSDWFFVMGRHAAAAVGQAEVLWRPGSRSP